MLIEQEAQLSQRGRAMLRVIEYFAKSLKVIQRYSSRTRVSSSIVTSSYLFFAISETFTVNNLVILNSELRVIHSLSLKVAPV